MAQDMYMSDQAVGAVMMALQKSLMSQSDIVPTLKEFKFRLSEAGLMVLNPPLVKQGHEDAEEGLLVREELKADEEPFASAE